VADPRFFSKAGPFSLADLARRGGAELAPGVDGARMILDVAPLDAAQQDHISFLDNRKYVEVFLTTRAGACLVEREFVERAPAGTALLLTPDPYRSYAKIAQAFYPTPAPVPGIAEGAFVDASAKLGDGVRVERGAVVEADAVIGARCLIRPNAVVGAGVVLGDDCVIGSNASVSHAVLANRVVVYPGVCIGQDGFGFAMGAEGHVKVPQLGRVLIDDDVEIGANTTIDRGAGPDTVIGAGTKIDNLVQIGHNVQLGRGCVIVAQVGISGSTRLGDFVVVAGQAGITGHLRIGSGAKIAGQSGVMRDVAAGTTVGGSPAVPMAEWLRQSAELGRMGKKQSR
jgi:UDP-3-O-[3-hydroxymyristoyl] glucosamine N-acyltransferase